MAEQAKYSDQARTSTEPLFRQEMKRHITNIDFQMKDIRRAMEGVTAVLFKDDFRLRRCGPAICARCRDSYQVNHFRGK